MAERKIYKGSFNAYIKKLESVMKRINVSHYNYDWTKNSCYVELVCKGRAFRFEKSLMDAAENGKKITAVSDLFAQIVLMLEDLARAADRGLYDFSQIISGLPSLPEGAASLEPCFIALGFAERPTGAEEVRLHYRNMLKVVHPDCGGDSNAFQVLKKNYDLCMQLLSTEQSPTAQ